MPRDVLLASVEVRVAFDLVSVEDGSSHTVEAYGEALDGSDKATAKAMSAAYKSVMVQTFCIPVIGAEEPDRHTHKLRSSRTHEAEPVQGWQQWAADIAEIVSLCESNEALERVQNSNRPLLKAISRERPDIYSTIGEAFARRRGTFAAPTNVPKPRPVRPSLKRTARTNSRRAAGKSAEQVEAVHA